MTANAIKATAGFALLGICLAVVLGTLAFFHFQEVEATSISPVGPASSCEQNETIGHPIDWSYLKSINPDVVAWITVPGTNVDYPVVQSSHDDPDYYLAHDFEGNFNVYGCPYLDSECSLSEPNSKNCIIYGHNMGWGDAMFADLENFDDESFAISHRQVIIATPNGNTTQADVYAVCVIDGSTALKRTDFQSTSEFEEYCAQLDGQARHSFGKIDATEQLITLCTCTYFQNPANERTLVLAKHEGHERTQELR